jgi:hypothetical protein
MPSGSRLVSAFGAYTSGSRHREQSFIVTSEGAERAEVIGRRPLGDRRKVTATDLLDNLTRNLSRQPVRESALDLIERANSLRRGTIHTVQRGLERMESRAAAGKAAFTLHERFDEHRVVRGFERGFPSVSDRLARFAETIVAAMAEASSKLTAQVVAFVKERADRYIDGVILIRRFAQGATQDQTSARPARQAQRRGLRS